MLKHCLKSTCHIFTIMGLFAQWGGKDRVVEHTYLDYFDHIKEKTVHLATVFKVNSPCNESMVVWRCPSISCEMEMARMFLESQCCIRPVLISCTSKLTWSNLPMWPWHFKNAKQMSCEIVKHDGRSILGCPASRRSWRARSLIMLVGWLFSVSQLTRLALG